MESLDDLLAGSVARALLDTLPARTAVVDERGTVIAVNAVWRASAPRPPDEALDLRVGSNVFEVFAGAIGPTARVDKEGNDRDQDDAEDDDFENRIFIEFAEHVISSSCRKVAGMRLDVNSTIA